MRIGDTLKINVKNDKGKNLVRNRVGIQNEPSKVKVVKQGDKTTYIVPAIIIGEAVLYGMGYDYPELVTGASIQNAVQLWNDTPVVVYHPFDDARELEVIEAELVGRVYKPRLLQDEDTDAPLRLLVDLHIDRDALIEKDEGAEVETKILNETMIEVSTGYYLLDFVEQRGEYNGEPFKGIQLSHLPNHLALLPNSTGAYSVAMGGGAVRDNKKDAKDALTTAIDSWGALKSNRKEGNGKDEKTNQKGDTMDVKQLLKNAGVSADTIEKLSEAEAKQLAKLAENKATADIDKKIETRMAEFKKNFATSDEGKKLIDDEAEKLNKARAEKEARENAWADLKGKTNLTREDLDTMPVKAVEVLRNSVNGVKPPVPDDEKGGSERENKEAPSPLGLGEHKGNKKAKE